MGGPIVAGSMTPIPYDEDGYRVTFYLLCGEACGYVEVRGHIEAIAEMIVTDLGLGLFCPCVCNAPQWVDSCTPGMLECGNCGGDEHATFFGE